MKKLDLYIIKKYLVSFFFTTFLITLVSIVINYSEQVHRFIKADLGFVDVMSQYYLYYIPWINGLMWPLFSLISVIFFTSRLAKNSEIVASLSSGISNWRILVPYLVSAFIISFILWIGKNYIIPYSNKVKHDFESEVLDKDHKKTMRDNIHFFLNQDQKIFIHRYLSRDTSAMQFRLETFQDGELTKVLSAERLSFKEAPKLWTVKNYDIREINGMQESIVVAHGETMDTIIDLTHDDFVRNTKGMENMSTSDLREHILRKKERGISAEKNYLVELHLRTSQPFAIIILTIIGFAVASRKTRGGMGLHLAIGVIIGAAYVVISQFSSTFSNNLSLSPLLGAWIPNLLFAAVAVYLMIRGQN